MIGINNYILNDAVFIAPAHVVRPEAIPAWELRICSFKYAGLKGEERKGRDLTFIICLLCDFFFFSF